LKEGLLLKVSLIQVQHDDNIGKADCIKRVNGIISNLDETDMIILPELWNVGFFSFDKYKKNCEKLDGKFITDMSDMAKNKNCYIFTGSFIEEKNGGLFNTGVLFDRKGNISAVYRKNHLFGDEKNYLSQGTEIVTAQTEFGRIGFGICYDLRFPEHFRSMNDAQIFIVASAWPYARKEHLEILTRARAIENQALVLSCCMCGINYGCEYSGSSMAVSPKGSIIFKAALSETYDTISADLSEIYEYREVFPVLKDKL